MLGLRQIAAPPPDSAVLPLFPHVVAGIDFGPASLAAARWAFAHIARDAHALLSHVAAASDDDRDGDGDSPLTRSVQELAPALSGGLGGFAATLPVASARSVVRFGRPSHWLRTLADGTEASLIVLGRRSNANRRRVGEPNVIERVTRRTSATVLVVPEGAQPMLRYIVAAIDRSPMGTRVLAIATALSKQFGYGVIVLHVVPPPTGGYARIVGNKRRAHTPNDGGENRITSPDVLTRHVPRWLADRARHDPTRDEPHVRIAIGDPAREIMATARDLGAAMVIVGKRGDDDAPIGSVGSVARELLASAPVPVLAVDVDAHACDSGMCSQRPHS